MAATAAAAAVADTSSASLIAAAQQHHQHLIIIYKLGPFGCFVYPEDHGKPLCERVKGQQQQQHSL